MVLFILGTRRTHPASLFPDTILLPMPFDQVAGVQNRTKPVALETVIYITMDSESVWYLVCRFNLWGWGGGSRLLLPHWVPLSSL